MKHTLFSLSLLAVFCLAALPVAQADTTPKAPKAAKSAKADKGKKKVKKPGKVVGVVGQYMSALTEEGIWSGGMPATDAEFYIYLTSASWCGPCNMEMPHVVEAYREMREDGRVELVQISGDRAPEAAKGFAEKFGAEFTVLNPRVEGSVPPPGYISPNGIPHATIVDSEGNVIKDGHGAIVKSWKQFTIESPDYKSHKPGKAKKPKKDKKGK